MYFSLILTIAVLCTAGVCADSPEEIKFVRPLTQKEKLRLELQNELKNINRRGVQKYCNRQLSRKELIFANQKLEEFTECGNASINLLMGKLGDNVKFDQLMFFRDVVREYAAPVCEIFDDIFQCVTEFNPVIDMCLNESEKIFKNKLFTIVPLLHQTICLRNGSLITDLFHHVNGSRCFHSSLDNLNYVDGYQYFSSESTELFGDAQVCQRFNDVLQQIYVNVGECSPDFLEMVKVMLGYLCEGSKCDRFIDDLKCY